MTEAGDGVGFQYLSHLPREAYPAAPPSSPPDLGAA